MGLKRNYSGYKSFSYLELGVDYEMVKLAKEVDRVEPYLVPLSASEEERVNRIVSENPVISLHDHPDVFPDDFEKDMLDYSKQDMAPTAFEGLSKSCYDCVFFNMPSGRNTVTSPAGLKFSDVTHHLGMRLADIAHQDFVIIATKVDDILRAHKEGKIAFVASIEGAGLIENELDRIDLLYGFGVRIMGLSYSESSQLATGLKEDRDGGLTYFGRECVDRMNKIGMAIDTSHSSPQSTIDAAEVSKKPVFATHTGAMALWNIKRLKPDNALKAITDKGGIIGIEAPPHTTITKRHPEQSIESYMEHFEYIRNLVGTDHVGFGPDTLFGDHNALHSLFSKKLSMAQAFTTTGVVEPPYVKGLENPAECSWNIPRWLVKHGYSDEDIAKAIGGNAIRVLREVWY